MKVVVIGAGYAGSLAANRLTRKVSSAEVTVVNPRPDFVERVRLHQRVAGTATAAVPLERMLRDGVAVRVASVVKVGDGAVVLDTGEAVEFDYAFLAVGSTVRPMPGTVPIGTWEGAEQARARLAALPAGAVVTVVGGGSTGVETASEVAEARPDLRVRIIGSPVGDGYSHRAFELIRAGLAELGVEIVDDSATAVADGRVRLRSGGSHDTDLTLWAIVSGVPDLATRSGLEVDGDGRVLVDSALRSISDPRVFAVGDCAAVPGARFACATAAPEAGHAVDNLARLVAGRPPEPFALRYLARAVSLGRRRAVGQLTDRDDALRRTAFSGRTAVFAKELATRSGRFAARTGFSG